MKRWLILAWLLPCLATAGTLEPLRAADVPALLAPPAHGERLIALWALDCAYCEPTLQALGRVQQAQPDTVELVTVATDDISQAPAIKARLRSAHMDRWPARAYAGPQPARLNFLIDPNWGGETPRVLVIRADGTRQGYSGELSPAQLRALQP